MTNDINHLLPDPQRVRQRMPKRFSWIDRRALERLQSARASQAYGLYLALVLLSDRHGLSYYSEKSLSHRLRISADKLRDARSQLIDAGLIAYRCPFYQVLDLEPLSATANRQPPTSTSTSTSTSTPASAGQQPPQSRREHRLPVVPPAIEPANSTATDTDEFLRQLRDLREQIRNAKPHRPHS